MGFAPNYPTSTSCAACSRPFNEKHDIFENSWTAACTPTASRSSSATSPAPDPDDVSVYGPLLLDNKVVGVLGIIGTDPEAYERVIPIVDVPRTARLGLNARK